MSDPFEVPYPHRYQAVNDYVRAGESPEGDLRRVGKLMDAAKKRGDAKDVRNVERADLVVRQMWRIDTSTFLKRALDLMSRAERANDYAVAGFVLETIGDECLVSGKFVKAFEYYLRAYELYHNTHKEAFPDMAESQMSLASGYFRFGDYSSALRYSKEVLNHHDRERPWISILIYDLVGSSYLELGMPDSAIIYFRRLADLAHEYHSVKGRITWRGIAEGKTGMALYSKKMHREAISFLWRGVDSCLLTDDASNVADFSICLYRIYHQQSNTGQMAKCLEIARRAVYKSQSLERFIDYYELMSQVKRREGNSAAALQYIDSMSFFRDSLSQIRSINKKYVAELDIVWEQRLASERKAEMEKSRLTIIRNSLIAVAVLLMLLTLFLYNRSMLKQKLHRQEILAEKRLSEAELLAATAQLEVIRKSLSERNELIAQLEEDSRTSLDTEVINRLQQSTILTEEQWDQYRALFEKAHPGFLQALRDKYPELSPSETRFMVLAKLDYSNKEMASTLGVSAQAIRTTWYRIKKKLELADEITIEELLADI